MKKMSKSAMVVLFCVLFVPFAATLYLVFFSAADATGFVQFIDTVIVPAIGEMGIIPFFLVSLVVLFVEPFLLARIVKKS
jgi:hypothetical protein